MTRACLLLGSLIATLGAPAFAHTAWLEPVSGRASEFRVMFGGHQGKTEPYDPAKLTSVDALDARGRKLTVLRSVGTDGVRLRVAERPALIAISFDNGVHARTAAGGPSVEKPMNEVAGAVSAVRALKNGKLILAWTPLVARPVGQTFEVTPLEATPPTAGRPMRVRVTLDGRPLAGVRLGHGEEGEAGESDAQGVTTFTPVKGPNRLWAGRRWPVADNPAYTQLSHEYLLGFDAK